MDGHSGIENNEVNKGGSGNFQFVLSYLKDSNGRGYFIIHSTSSISYSWDLHPIQFLEQIGLQHFQGKCKFFHDQCFFRIIAEAKYDDFGRASARENMWIHSAFKKIADGGINKLYELRKQQIDILRTIGLSAGPLEIFNMPIVIEPKPTDIPTFVDAIKFPRLLDLEDKRNGINQEIEDLKGFLPLVYADGDLLVSSVLKSQRFMGLKAELTKPGFTVDILAETSDSSMKFGLEVTGINEPIKKRSNKLTQLLEFERVKEHNEKTILVANTFKDLLISEREGKDNFSSEVVEFLSPYPILLMTGYDLYRVVSDILEEKKKPEYFIERFYKEQGVFEYNN